MPLGILSWRIAAAPEPIKPGADVGPEIPAVAGRAGLALELAHDAAHSHVAGQKHGVDERSQGLRVAPAAPLPIPTQEAGANGERAAHLREGGTDGRGDV